MKIAIISDTHFGIRNDNNSLLDYFEIFYEKVFFPYLEENNIDTVIIPGDLVDRRKYININTARRMREMFLDRLKSYKVYITIGNHDCFFKNTNKVNVFNELNYNNLNVFIEPEEVDFDGTKILFVPWICSDNEKVSLEAIKKSRAPICIGHLEINGFEMHRGAFCEHGMEAPTLSDFDMVLSGHFHKRSTKENITYLGTPYQMTWADYGEKKGFHVLNTTTRVLEFIENPYQIFQKVFYNDKNTSIDKLLDFPEYRYSGTYVKIIIQEKNNPYWFDLFIEKIENSGALNIQFIDDNLNLNIESDENLLEMAEDTITILQNHVKQLDLGDKTNEINSLFMSLYNEASNIKV